MTKSELKDIIYESLYENNIISFNEYEEYIQESYIDKFKKFGLDIKQINYLIDDTVSKFSNAVSKNKTGKESSRAISDIVISLYNDLADIIKNTDIKFLKFKIYDFNKLKNGFLLSVFTIILNIASERFLALYLYSKININNKNMSYNDIKYGVSIIASVTLIPIIEEFAKYASIRIDCKDEFFIIFNTVEFSSYMVNFKINHPNHTEVDLLKYGASRGLSLLVHDIFLEIHILFNNPKIQKLFGVLDSDSSKKTAAFIGQIISVIAHGLWNAFGYKITNRIFYNNIE